MLRILITLHFLACFPVCGVADQTSTPQGALRSNPPNVFAITGASVVSYPDATAAPATIVVRHGRIEAIGADVQVPADAREIDHTGKTIYVGFIDAYSEQAISTERLNGSARYWNRQVTPQLSVADQLPANADIAALRK